jgi:hypothetical protein
MTKRRMIRRTIATIAACALLLSGAAQSLPAYTGITLKARGANRGRSENAR